MSCLDRLTSFPFQVLLLLVVVAVSVVVSLAFNNARSQIAQHCSWWPVVSYMWNENIDTWARTSPVLNIGGFGDIISGSDPPTCDSPNPIESRNPSFGFLQYYHDNDPDCPYSQRGCWKAYDTLTIGKLLGYAWAPLFGEVRFSENEFPPNQSCYGLTGADRQPRVISFLDQGSLRFTISGCAYVPFFNDWILFSKYRSDGTVLTDSKIPSSWEGVVVNAHATSSLVRNRITLAQAPYLKMFNCGWSAKGGYWSFGPNQSSTTGCLPNTHSYIQGGSNTQGDSYARFFESVAGKVVLNSLRSSARVGQTIAYNVQCPQGYKKVTFIITEQGSSGTPVERVHTPYDLTYEQVFSTSITDIKIRCEDLSGLFPGQKDSGSVAGVYVDVFFVPVFEVSPEVIAEGGFVSFSGIVSNWGDPDNNAVCSIYDRTPGRPHRLVQEFPAQGLNNRVDGKEVVVRDTVYELECRYLNEAATQQLRDGTVTDPTTFADTYWETTSPVRSVVKVFPSRVDERNVITDDVCVPRLTKTGIGTANEKVTVSIQGGAGCVSDAASIQEIRVYALSHGGSITNPFASVNSQSIVQKTVYTKGSLLSDACSKTLTTARRKELVNQEHPDIFSEVEKSGKKDVEVIDNCAADGIADIAVERSDLSRTNKEFSGKVFVAEVVTNDGRRSEKVVLPISCENPPCSGDSSIQQTAIVGQCSCSETTVACLSGGSSQVGSTVYSKRNYSGCGVDSVGWTRSRQWTCSAGTACREVICTNIERSCTKK
ncbi:MAG: hypothetical protein OYG31_03305 [Candidatus Kaiserbacteria bacterium]|nr:hypothetical protein [Candidatus Kaiserbacteria bacterium]